MTAYNAECALAMARRTPPEVLVSSLSLKGMNGADLARVVRSKSCDCRVILLSAFAESDSLIAGVRIGGCNFTLLQKPVHPNELQALLPAMRR